MISPLKILEWVRTGGRSQTFQKAGSNCRMVGAGASGDAMANALYEIQEPKKPIVDSIMNGFLTVPSHSFTTGQYLGVRGGRRSLEQTYKPMRLG